MQGQRRSRGGAASPTGETRLLANCDTVQQWNAHVEARSRHRSARNFHPDACRFELAVHSNPSTGSSAGVTCSAAGSRSSGRIKTVGCREPRPAVSGWPRSSDSPFDPRQEAIRLTRRTRIQTGGCAPRATTLRTRPRRSRRRPAAPASGRCGRRPRAACQARGH